MSTESDVRQEGGDSRSRLTEAIVDFLEDRGLTTYAVKREPSSITLSLPNEPESAVEKHLAGLRDRLQGIVIGPPSGRAPDFVIRDPRDHHAIIVEIKAPGGQRLAREQLVDILRSEESELRRRGIVSLTLIGSASTATPYPNDVDLLVRFHPDLRLSAFDVAAIQLHLEQRTGRRVDICDEKTFPAEFTPRVTETGIRIFDER